MSKNFARIKRYFEKGLYSIANMQLLVQAEAITAAEYQTITGQAIS